MHGDKTHVNAVINEAFSPFNHVEYRLCLGFHPEGKEPEGQRPVGWGVVAVKISRDQEPKHYPFKICHKGYFCTFQLGTKSVLVRYFLTSEHFSVARWYPQAVAYAPRFVRTG